MCFSFIAIVAHCSTCIVRLKLANNNVFGLQIGGEEINNHYKNIVGAFGHLGIEIQEVVKRSARASCTYSIMVMFINVGRIFLMKTNIDGKLTLGHNQIAKFLLMEKAGACNTNLKLENPNYKKIVGF